MTSYDCPVCDATYAGIRSLQNHLTGTHNGVDRDRPDIEGTAACPDCGVGGMRWRYTTQDWRCRECTTVTDEPVERPPKQPPNNHIRDGSVAAILDAMSVDEFDEQTSGGDS